MPLDGAALLSQRDPTTIRRLLRLARPFLRGYFRARVDGLEAIPEGPCVIVANHNIGAPWEVFALLEAWEAHFQGKRPVCGLAHELAFRFPVLRSFMPRVGAVRATYEHGHAVLGAGGSLAIFPGGNWEAARPFTERNRCDFDGHKGWARIALAAGVPVVPVSIVGSHAINPVFFRSRLLAWLGLGPPLFRVRFLPLTLAQLLGVGLALGLGLAFLPWWAATLIAWLVCFSPVTVFFPLLPSRIEARCGAPIDVAAATADLPPGENRVDRAYHLVVERLQAGMDALVASRRGVLG